ncbi:26S proteasome regulatory subunit 6A-A-like isoform X2 [Penaeus chinensis]|uniref:26S proteasome regulatory subunit 6A-A-like isoform X2 n=1 Tax=Penaeus chinensis TaxID=139456 RepID=UPI001FB73696|nr:26S proteasome regulatory subunit 6A-A-like isoform X2 [Penaeus chinensis]
MDRRERNNSNNHATRGNSTPSAGGKWARIAAKVVIAPPSMKEGVIPGACRDASYVPIRTVVISTSTLYTLFLPLPGLVDAKDLKPGDLVAVLKDTFIIIETLPKPHDPRVIRMEVTERPTQTFSDIGGLQKQIEELKEAVILPIKQRERFKKIGISPTKGVLLHGPPGAGKTMMARACAGETSSTFIRLAGPQLVEIFLGDGAKMVHDAFALAKEKAPSIIFIDEIDAIGTKRFSSDKSGDREVQRTMLALLTEMDGFTMNDTVTVLAATNRAAVLDPALLRSGRFDKKIEIPLPCEEERYEILKIHSRKINCRDVDLREIARTAGDFSGAQCRAVCVEAAMTALRRNASTATHEDFLAGIVEVSARKKIVFSYVS